MQVDGQLLFYIGLIKAFNGQQGCLGSATHLSKGVQAFSFVLLLTFCLVDYLQSAKTKQALASNPHHEAKVSRSQTSLGDFGTKT